MELLRDLLFAVSALSSAGWAIRLWLSVRLPERRPLLFCAQLALVMMAGLSLCGLGQSALGWDTRQAWLWLDQALRLLGLPLLVLACVHLTADWQWAKPVWGQLILGLCVGFEVTRVLGWSLGYELGLGIVMVLMLVWIAWRLPELQDQGVALAAAVLLAGLLPLDSYWQALLLTPLGPLLLWLLVRAAPAKDFVR